MNPQQFYGGGVNTGSNYPSAPGKSKLTRRTRLLLIVTAVLVVVAILAGAFSATNVNPSEKLLQLGLSGDVDRSYQLFTSGTQKEFSRENWGAEVSVLSNLYSSYALDAESKSDDTDNPTTTYRYTLVAKNQSSTISWVIVEVGADEPGGKVGVLEYSLHSLEP